MRRAFGSILALAIAGAAMSQSSFTIVRPADGSKVRETVRLLFPKNSIPDGGYVGIYLGGKFVEATVPARGANYLYYDIDTKARQIADGPLTIEAVLFQEFSDKPRIVDRTSIQVTIANSANIPIPEDGIKLRYKFKPGTQWIYRLSQRVALNNMSEAMAGSTSKSSLLAGTDTEQIRLGYYIDNAYGDGDGLVRIQALPEPGKHDLMVTTFDSDVPEAFKDHQVHPVYMRLRSTGREVFGSVPRYFPLEGSAGEAFKTDLLAVYPLPTLPDAPVRQGVPWQTGFQLGDLDLNMVDDAKSLVARLKARGELVGVEWQNGHPCARLKHSLELRDPKAGGGSSSRLVGAQAIDEDIWFALDLGTVIKMVRTYTIEQKIDAPVGGTNTGGQIAGAGGANRGTGPQPPSRGGAGGAQGANWQTGSTPNNQGRRGGGRGGAQGDGPPGQLGGGSGRMGGTPGIGGVGGPAGAAGQGGRSGGQVGTRIVRITVEQVFELEK